MINSGYIEGTNGDVSVRVYYDSTANGQPLVDGPRGYCLDMTNVSGKTVTVTLVQPDGSPVSVNVGSGDPVSGGPPSGRSRTAAQVNVLGFFTRGDVSGFQGPV